MHQHSTESTQAPVPSAQLLKAKPLAKILNCGVSTVYFLARSGKIPTISIGKAGVRFNADDVIAVLTRTRPR